MENRPLRADEERLLEFRRTLEESWRKGMPPHFFRLNSEEEQTVWLNALWMFQYTGASVTLRKENTVYQVGDYSSSNLVRNLEKLQDEEILGTALYRSQEPIWEEGGIVEFARFELRHTGEPRQCALPQEMVSIDWEGVQESLGNQTGKWYEIDKIQDLASGFACGFVQNSSPERLASFLALYLRCEQEDSLLVKPQIFWKNDGSGEGFNRILLGTLNPPSKGFILRIARVLEKEELRLNRLVVSTTVPLGEEEHPENWLGLSGLYITDPMQRPLLPGDPRYESLLGKLRHARLSAIGETMPMGGGPLVLKETEEPWEQDFLRITGEFLEVSFSAILPVLFHHEAVKHALQNYPKLSRILCLYFHARCHPWERNAGEAKHHREKLLNELKEFNTGVPAEDHGVSTVLGTALAWISHIRRTNFFREEKAAFGFSVDPEILNHFPESAAVFEMKPDSLIFLVSPDFIGFHVGFSNLARGGVRTVLPPSVLRYQAARRGVMRECYDLARTQHFKNKDIPEGGAKGALVVRPGFPQRPAQRAWVREFIALQMAREQPDRISDMPELKPGGSTLFLGPDENMTNDMIIWINDFSEKLDTAAGPAMMSGHPEQGINHKRFGVTSRGVITYMDEGLRFLGIDPTKEEFRVKFSGGPDGDVAGNGIRILIEDYPDTVKIVAITDGTGYGHDPDGFNQVELMRLFREGVGIASFAPAKLGPQGRLLVLSRDPQKPPMLYCQVSGELSQEPLEPNQSNRIHQRELHQVPAEVFIPAGGRPNTLNEGNWEWYLIDGKPSASLIVEGANLYLNTAARRELEGHGVLIIKDSSANKCGVITSSYEVLGLLLMGAKRMRATLEKFIPDLMKILVARSRQEAQWLLSNYEKGNPEKALTLLSRDYSAMVRREREEAGAEFAEDMRELDRLLRDSKQDPATLLEGKPKVLFQLFQDYLPHRYLNEVSAVEAWQALSPDHRLAMVALQKVNGIPSP